MSSIKDNRWVCSQCGVEQGPNDMWFEGDICGDCNEQNDLMRKKDTIETILINTWTITTGGIPDDFEDQVQEVFEDVCASQKYNNIDWIKLKSWLEKIK